MGILIIWYLIIRTDIVVPMLNKEACVNAAQSKFIDNNSYQGLANNVHLWQGVCLNVHTGEIINPNGSIK